MGKLLLAQEDVNPNHTDTELDLTQLFWGGTTVYEYDNIPILYYPPGPGPGPGPKTSQSLRLPSQSRSRRGLHAWSWRHWDARTLDYRFVGVRILRAGRMWAGAIG
ncbi:hypothetical protein L873DRAFT_1769987 [Choiromyces venosus 120613-1]|uniref:Uncharacterized protein n=1 Tax=Choiromyces venosus 120613-1 TaxID=1336337 RepID=A0A3N4JLC2_9PEZI|nr:hypothetical protein L873DRAFT_1769987 [Choiromyces venosus 120613-1]